MITLNAGKNKWQQNALFICQNMKPLPGKDNVAA
jgi:hypothetical protein